jgi:hypothetical protein
MTPYEIIMLIEIYVGPQEPTAPDSPLKRQTLERFQQHGLIEGASDCERGYRATERTKVYIDALCETPWPVQKWVMPSVSET